jgi:hypothetical protein
MAKHVKSSVKDLYEKFLTPIHIILYFVFAIPIIFVAQIPDEYKKYGSNILVRIILFGLIVLVNNYISYIHALMFAMFVILYVSFTPGIKESFEDLRIVARKEKRWYDEQVIGENPKLMETEKVRTEAVQSS